MKAPAILSLSKYDIAYTVDFMFYIVILEKLKTFSCSLQAFIFFDLVQFSGGLKQQLVCCSLAPVVRRNASASALLNCTVSMEMWFPSPTIMWRSVAVTTQTANLQCKLLAGGEVSHRAMKYQSSH